MTMRIYRRLLFGIFLFGLGTLLLGTAPRLWAQETVDQNILGPVDCESDFPTCQLRFFHPQLAEEIDAADLLLRVDGEPTAIISATRSEQPLHVLFVLDAPQVIRQGGIPTRFKDAVIDLHEWFEAGGSVELLQKDSWAAYMIGAATADDLAPIAEWQRGNYGGFRNTVVPFVEGLPAGGPTTTSLFGPLRAAVESFPDGDGRRVIVLFSDGFDRIEADREAVIQAALAQDVRIFTVLHWAGGGAVAEENLRTLAARTGGQFANLTTTSDLTPFWQALRTMHYPALVTFPMPTGAPQRLALTLSTADGDTLTEAAEFPRVNIPAPAAPVLTVNGQAGDRVTIPADAETLQIELSLSTEDGRDAAERITAVEYAFGDERFLQSTPPFTAYTLSLAESRLGEAPRSLIAYVTDKYGSVIVRSAPINIGRELPPTPTPEPTPTATPTPEPTATTPAEAAPTSAPTVVSTLEAVPVAADQGDAAAPPTLSGQGVQRLLDTATGQLLSLRVQWGLTQLSPEIFLGGVVGLPLLLLVLLGVLIGRRPRRTPPPSMQGHWTDSGDATQPAEMDDATNPAVDIFASATLVLERGGAELPREIALFPIQQVNGEIKYEWKLGRSGAYSDYVIDDRDRRVSKLHATIIESNNQFFIRDEGSAGGTYVNRKKLTPREPVLIANGDLINFNTVTYKFVLEDETGMRARSEDDTDVTEPG
ncbi:FHA domain-containing protein [bacterium]|nr:FHA domain-containing protein [bacterium]